MDNEINYKNNPLHGVSLKKMLTEIVDHYGFEILFAYLNINCFKNNPSIASSIKFLKKTDWAREKVEVFYLYEFKNLPKASPEQFLLSPRDRIIPDDQTPGEPADLSLEDAERLREKRTEKADAYGKDDRKRAKSNKNSGQQASHHSDRQVNKPSKKIENELADSSDSSNKRNVDPWAKHRNKSNN